MHAAAGQTQHHVAGDHVLAGQDFRFFDRADAKTGQVVFTRRVHARHFSCFAADERAVAQFAAACDAANHSRSRVHVELAAGEVVEEKQRFGALHQHVVDAHRHQVDADGVVHVPLESQFQLGADAVGAADQHRLFVALGHLEQRAEAAYAGQHAFAHGFFGQWLDAFDQGIAGVDVNAGVFVAQRGGGGWSGHGKSGGWRAGAAR